MSTQSTTIPTSFYFKPARTGNSRGHLALFHIDVELAEPKYGVAVVNALTADEPGHDYVADIIKANQQDWDALINNEFCQQMADGTASLDGFKWYMVQDMIFLKEFVYWKLGYFAKAPWETVVAKASKSIGNDVGYVQSTKDICVGDLKIPEHVVLNAEMADIVKEFHDFMTTTIANGDWLCLNVLMLPCIMGYYEIALKFIRDPKYPPSARETVFWKDWILLNDPGNDETLYKYKTIVNRIFKQYDSPEDRKKINEWFKRMCQLETKFFVAAMTEKL